jgi:hypothetical protein
MTTRNPASDEAAPQYHSFVLRVWQEAGAGSGDAWNGEVESIQSGQKWSFGDLETAFRLVSDLVNDE